VTRKENFATRLAGLALPTAPNKKKRHETLQRFMLINDSVTVAVEIPVFLTREDVRYYCMRGFDLDFQTDVITGHIDFLQDSQRTHPHPRLQAGCRQRKARACAAHHLRARSRATSIVPVEGIQVRLVR